MTAVTRVTQRANTITVTLGRKGSGKSHYVRRRWTDHEPRLITLDYTGEAVELDPGAHVVHDTRGAADALARLLRANVRQFHIVARMRPAETERLYALLVSDDPQRPSTAAAFGGLAITCDEMSLVAPLHATPDSVTCALMLGRHAKLSQHYATQRPQNIGGAVKGQTDYITVFRMHEPRERKWVADTIGVAVADRVRDLPPRHFFEYECNTGLVTLKDGHDRVLLSRDIADLTREHEGARA